VQFALVILVMGVLCTICSTWPQTVILPASHVLRIPGVSHWCLAEHHAFDSHAQPSDNLARRQICVPFIKAIGLSNSPNDC
jgi:hypothetical protein